MITGSKYVSVLQIINQVYRDLGVTDFNLADAIEWAGEAMEFIGAADCYLDKAVILEVKDGRVKLPCGLHYIEQVRAFPTDDVTECPDIKKFSPMRYSTNSFAHFYCEGNRDCFCDSELTYIVNDDFLKPSFTTGFVAIAYTSIAIDDENRPLIPDDVKFKNAVSYHIQEKLAFRMLMSGKIQQIAYDIISRNRDFYIGAANTRGNMPSVDQMENIKNDWLRLIPKLNHHANGFASLGVQEKRFNHNSQRTIDPRGNSDDTTTFFHFKDSAE